VSGRIQRMAWGRLNVSKWFDSSCTIRREGVDLVGPLDGGLFACCVLTLAQGGRIEGDFSYVNSWVIRLPVETDVQIDDYVIERERTLQVIEVQSPTSYELFKTVICQRV
jgi:hypothetical protein